MDEEKKVKYRYLINSLYSIINNINDSKTSITELDQITENGIKVDNESLNKQVVSDVLSTMDNTCSRLRSAIYSMKKNMNKEAE